MWPSRSSAHTGVTRGAGARRRRCRVGGDRAEHRRVGAVELDQRPGERLGRAGAWRAAAVTHAHVVISPAGPDLDELGEVLARDGVELGRRAR